MTTLHSRRLLSRRLVVASSLAAMTLPGLERALAQSADQATPLATPGATPLASETPVGSTFAWLLEAMNTGGANLTEADLAGRFTTAFLDDVPAPDILALFEQMGTEGPYSIESYEESPDGLDSRSVIAGSGGVRISVTLSVTDDSPPLIAGFWVRPALDEITSWEQLGEAWTSLAESSNFLVAEVVDGECVPVYALNADERLAIGSAFKFYILGELADQVREGALDWDDPLAIRDEWKTTFSGPMHVIPEGEERTLREFASEMISISDNTATDHLLFFLGRENVEAMQAEMGHGAPELNQPMISAHELFQLKFGASPDLIERYLAAPEAERREILETEVASIELGPLATTWWTDPLYIDQLEWFASAEDLCHALATLHVWSQEPGLEPIAEILAINPALPLDPEVWPFVGFKGGSEIGVLSLNWLLGHASGRTFVLSATLNDTQSALDTAFATGPLEAAVQLLESSL